jgi:hypothetical protein
MKFRIRQFYPGSKYYVIEYKKNGLFSFWNRLPKCDHNGYYQETTLSESSDELVSLALRLKDEKEFEAYMLSMMEARRNAKPSEWVDLPIGQVII